MFYCVRPIHIVSIFYIFTSNPHFLCSSTSLHVTYSKSSWSWASNTRSSSKHNAYRVLLLFRGIPMPTHFFFHSLRACSKQILNKICEMQRPPGKKLILRNVCCFCFCSNAFLKEPNINMYACKKRWTHCELM